MNTKYIISLTGLIALTGAPCWGAASNPNPEMPIGSLALLYAEGSADRAPRILALASLDRKNLLQLALIGRKESERFPNLYRDARRKLFNQKGKFQQLLQQHNGNVRRALFEAAQNNKPWAIDYLVQNGADLNARDKYDRTALILAAHAGHEAVVAQLIAAQANVNAKDNRRRTALIQTAYHGHGAVLAQLITARANVDAKDNHGQTALMWATQRAYEAVVAQLIAATANLNARNNQGRTTLMLAANRGDGAIVAQLIAAGADIDARDYYGWTALMLAGNVVFDNQYDQARRDGARAAVNLLTRGR